MERVSDRLKDICRAIWAAEKFTVQEIRISFEAPDPKNPKLETLSIEKMKKNEALFQWVRYSMLFKDVEGNDYVYIVSLNPWGTKQEDSIIYHSDDKGNLYKEKSVDLLPRDAERAFPSLLRAPDLIPPQKYRVNYVNTHKTNRGAEYSMEEFKRYFDNDFYTVFSKDKRVVNPFGKLIGKSVEPEEVPEEEKI